MPSTAGIAASGHLAWPKRYASTLALWLDAADTATITASAGRVSQWNDKSGNNRHAVEATASVQPATGVETLNGLNVLTWVAYRMSIANSTAYFKFMHDGTQYAVFAVAEFGTVANPNATYALMGNVTTDSQVGVNISYEDKGGFNNQLLALVYAGSNTRVVLAREPDVITPNGPTLLSLRMDPGNATASQRALARVNRGSTLGSNTLTATPSTANASTSMNIGRADNSLWLTGYIAEIIIIRQAMSSAQALEIEDYLARKWGL